MGNVRGMVISKIIAGIVFEYPPLYRVSLPPGYPKALGAVLRECPE